MSLTQSKDDLTVRDVGRSLLNSVVLASTSIFLLLISCLAFLFFYYYNVPAIAVFQTAHLQHLGNSNPYAHIDLEFSTAKLATSQAYDVIVELLLPDSKVNHDIGNFMVQLDMLSDSQSLVTSARPAIMKYTSPLIDTVSTVLLSAPILLGIKKESQKITVPVLEGYSFEAGWLTNPSHAKIELHAPEIQVYSCNIMFQSKLEGLNWMLYNFRVTSFLVFTSLFWISSMLFMLCSWALITFVLFPTTPRASSRGSSSDGHDDEDQKGYKVSSRSDSFLDTQFMPGHTSPSDVKSESSPGSLSSLSTFPRMPAVPFASGSSSHRSGKSAQSRTAASSSNESRSFFQFDEAARDGPHRSARDRMASDMGTEDTSIGSDTPHIKEESDSDAEFI